MNTLSRTRDKVHRASCRAVGVAGLCLVILATQPAEGWSQEKPRIPAGDGFQTAFRASGGRISSSPRAWPARGLAGAVPGARASSPASCLPEPSSSSLICDVALRPDGVLLGRVASGREARARRTAAGLPVRLVRGHRIIAETKTDVDGSFVFRGLPGGVYQAVVETGFGPAWQLCRVWTSSGAPPHASDVLTVPLGRGVARGQSPLPRIQLPRAATMTAIAAGAIAVPIIYNNVERDDAIPASP